MFEQSLVVGNTVSFGIPLLFVLDFGCQDEEARPRLVFVIGVVGDGVADVVNQPEKVLFRIFVEVFFREGEKFVVRRNQFAAGHRDGVHFLFEFALLFSPCADEAYNHQEYDDDKENKITGHCLLSL